MEIPENVQDKLKCSECDELLSCGPVYLMHETGGIICGRCSEQSQESTENDPDKNSNKRTRNAPYEATAALLAFPCAYANRGCPEKIQFSLGRPPHESICKFRPIICPVAPRGSCHWIGSWPKLEQHCDEEHPLNVLKRPWKLPRPDLTSSSLQTFVVTAFRFLFLVHVKVCVASGKIFHSARMFGDSKFLSKSSYSLEINGNHSKITKKGLVLEPGVMMLQEPTANYVLINSLLDILDGKYNESEFAITIQTSATFNCKKCLVNIVDAPDSVFCIECQGKLAKCEFNPDGCLYLDANRHKCEKHAIYFCKYQTECFLCKVNFVGGSVIEHLSSSTSCAKTTKANINSIVRFPQTNDHNYILFSSNNIGTIICRYNLSNCILLIWLYTSLMWHELKNYKCSMELTDPQTRHTRIVTPQIRSDSLGDWYIYVNATNFPSWRNSGIDIKLNIDEI